MRTGRKIIIIVIGSIIAAYGITLAMYAGFGGATLAVFMTGPRYRLVDSLSGDI